jgi:hypothetical protein
MKYIKTYEGWKENLAVGLSLAGSVAMGADVNKSFDYKEKPKVEQTNNSQDFNKACLAFCQIVKQDYTDIETRSAFLEASKYFQSERDGLKPEKLSKRGEKTVELVKKHISSLSTEEIQDLAKQGGGTVTGEIVGI